jgi:hypothetical protein
MIRDGCANKQPVGVCLRALTVLNSFIRPYFMDKDIKFRIVLALIISHRSHIDRLDNIVTTLPCTAQVQGLITVPARESAHRR